MEILDLIYLNNYNSNFLNDFKEFLKNHEVFNIQKIISYSDEKHEYHINLSLTKETTLQLYDANALNFKIEDYISSNNFNITNIIIIRKLLDKIINESDYTPQITRYSVDFLFDPVTYDLDFSCSFILELNR
jgi:hypothetical protein